MNNFLKINLVLIFFMLLTISCGNDDDVAVPASNDSRLLGTWEFKENRNTAIPRTVEAPTDEAPVIIRFLASKFQGTTAENDFSGTYSTDSNTLIIESFTSTENSDTGWGNQFYFAIYRNYNENDDTISFDYEVTESTLLIEYDVDSFLYYEKQ